MLELPLVFLGGLLGSSHCVGMCGGFALWVGMDSSSVRGNLCRQLFYSGGRIFTYAALGATVGYAGLRLVQIATPFVNLQAALAIAAGCLLIVQGLFSAGLLPRPSLHLWAGCLPARLLGPYLRGTGYSGYFLAGLFTGFLPCGLVYAYLALATATGTMAHGLTTMAAFGLGTVPLMVVAGLGSQALTATWRQRALRVAAVCVVLTGILSFARGANALRTPAESQPDCPFCASR